MGEKVLEKWETDDLDLSVKWGEFIGNLYSVSLSILESLELEFCRLKESLPSLTFIYLLLSTFELTQVKTILEVALNRASNLSVH